MASAQATHTTKTLPFSEKSLSIEIMQHTNFCIFGSNACGMQSYILHVRHAELVFNLDGHTLGI